MQVKDFLRLENIFVGMNATSKQQLIRQVSAISSEMSGVEASTIFKALLNREALGSTGIGNGIAIPHAGIKEIKKSICLAARLAKPIDFDAVDDGPVDIVFVILTPVDAKRESLNLLSCVARTMREEKTIRGLRDARTGDEFYALISP